jgi:alpha-L-fucosidase
MILAVALAMADFSHPQIRPPDPFGPLPSARQLKWHEMEFYGFIHFTVNTFMDREWGYGDEDPAIFDPKEFDAAKIVATFKSAGMKGLILVCKHHDGFCLWPTKTTAHNISKSPFRGGKGDMVREFADACRKAGLNFGLYLSPWDCNSALYGTPRYIELYRAQLAELLTSYGPIFETWHDGANGGRGFYGGARETRNIDRTSYYGWPETWAMVRQLQPGACIFSDIGPDVRWVGNESGFAAETSWATFTPKSPEGDPEKVAPGFSNYKEAEGGHRDGRYWIPAECDVSIRPGWFWHESENDKVKTPDQLMELYFRSVGRGANFLLNVPPDRRGRLHESDEASLREFGRRLRATFKSNLAAGAIVAASNDRGPGFSAKYLLDQKRASYWATEDGVATPSVELDFGRDVEFDVIQLREAIALGQRIEGFAVDAFADGKWKEIAKGTSVGNCRLVRLGAPVRARKVRLRITKSPVCVAVSELGLYRLEK